MNLLYLPYFSLASLLFNFFPLINSFLLERNLSSSFREFGFICSESLAQVALLQCGLKGHFLKASAFHKQKPDTSH